MTQINIESHDYLGKLTIIKNYLSLLLENANGETKAQLEIVFQTTQELIDAIKLATQNGQNTNH